MLAEACRTLVCGGAVLLTFCPNRDGRAVLFEPLSGLLSHDVGLVRGWLEETGARVEEEHEFDAYRSGRAGWVRACALLARKNRSAAVMPPTFQTLVERLRCPHCQGALCVPPVSPTGSRASRSQEGLSSHGFGSQRADSHQGSSRRDARVLQCRRCQTHYPVLGGLVQFLSTGNCGAVREVPSACPHS
jgi:hypothetical protein